MQNVWICLLLKNPKVSLSPLVCLRLAIYSCGVAWPSQIQWDIWSTDNGSGFQWLQWHDASEQKLNLQTLHQPRDGNTVGNNSITHTIHVWYIYLHLVDFYGKCREIYHTWIVWVMFFMFTNRFFTQMLHGSENIAPYIFGKKWW